MSFRNRFVSLAVGLALPAFVLAAPPKSKNPSAAEVDAALLRLYETDRPFKVAVHANESPAPGARLFDDLPPGAKLHPSYEATYALCQLHDAYNKSDTEVPEAAIDEYLASLQDMAPIQEALFVTGTTLADLKASWFRAGRGFEHVICGEAGKSSAQDSPPGLMAQGLAGYHFWYLFYRYEREGRARYLGADYGGVDDPAGMMDPRIVSGKMAVDFDGQGPKPFMPKTPRGGFIVGNSAAVLLAAGHIIHRGYGDAGDRSDFKANLNGKVYSWRFHTVDWEGRKSIRTFWPRFVPDALAAAASYAE